MQTNNTTSMVFPLKFWKNNNNILSLGFNLAADTESLLNM